MINTTPANIGGNGIAHLDPLSGAVASVDGGASVVAVGPGGQPWIVNKQGAIFRRSRGKNGYLDGTWATVPGQATDIAIGRDGSVWVIGVLQANIGGKMIYHYNPNVAAQWDLVDGGAVSIAADASGAPWLVNAQGAVFRGGAGKTGYVDGAWVPVAPNGTAISIGAGGPVS